MFKQIVVIVLLAVSISEGHARIQVGLQQQGCTPELIKDLQRQLSECTAHPDFPEEPQVEPIPDSEPESDSHESPETEKPKFPMVEPSEEQTEKPQLHCDQIVRRELAAHGIQLKPHRRFIGPHVWRHQVITMPTLTPFHASRYMTPLRRSKEKYPNYYGKGKIIY